MVRYFGPVEVSVGTSLSAGFFQSSFAAPAALDLDFFPPAFPVLLTREKAANFPVLIGGKLSCITFTPAR